MELLLLLTAMMMVAAAVAIVRAVVATMPVSPSIKLRLAVRLKKRGLRNAILVRP
jgi:hypothetical protein